MTLTSKLAQLELLDSIYNCAVDFKLRKRHTLHLHQIPPSYVDNRHHTHQHHSRIGTRTSILHCHCVRSTSCSWVEPHFYLIVPGANTDICKDEIQHLRTFAGDNNLKLSEDKTKEFVIMASRMWAPPPPCPDVQRVSRLRVLGVIMNDRLTAADHVTMLLWSSSSQMYAMRVLWVHNVLTASVHDIFRATVVSRIQYTSPAWSAEMCSAADRARLDSLTALWQMAWVLCRRHANRCWPIQHLRRRFLSPHQN